MKTNTLTPELLHKMDAYWRAASYLSVGQIYLYDNLLLKRPLALPDVKHMLPGHWGTTPGHRICSILGFGPDVPERPFHVGRTVQAPSCESGGVGKREEVLIGENTLPIFRRLG